MSGRLLYGIMKLYGVYGVFGISVYHYDYVIEQSTAIDNEMTYTYLLFSFHQKNTEPFITIEKETQY